MKNKFTNKEFKTIVCGQEVTINLNQSGKQPSSQKLRESFLYEIERWKHQNKDIVIYDAKAEQNSR